LTGVASRRPTPARLRVLAAAEGGLAMRKSALASVAGVSAGVIDGLVDEGALEIVALPPEGHEQPLPDFAAPGLSPAQRQAADALVQATAARAFSVSLLDGVTGSG